jgi:hypothetical protein
VRAESASGTPGGNRLAAAALVLGLAGASALRLWLTASVRTIYRQFPVDDLFYVRAAEHLLEGRWLGPYDQNALVKGIGYPLFLAAAHTLDLPRRPAEDLLLVGAVCVLAWALRRVGVGRLATLVAGVICLFAPSGYTMAIFRPVRENVYGSQTLLVMALAIALVAPAALGRRLGLAAILGLALAWFWNTREEAAWILPALGVLVGTVLWSEWHRRRRVLPALGCALALAAVPASVTTAATEWLRARNARAYGAPVTVELTDPDFVAAMAALGRVGDYQWERFAPLPAPARAELYRVSPAFRTLRPVLESRVYRGPNMETPSGERHFYILLWAVREAATRAGHHTSLPTAKAFYRQLADEINAACDDGRVAAGPPRRTMWPRLHPALHGMLVALWLDGIRDAWQLHFATGRVAALAEKADADPIEVARSQRILLEPADRPPDPRRGEKDDILQAVHVLLAHLLGWLVFAGALGVVAQLALWRSDGVGLLGIQLALLVAVATRAALSAIIRTYGWPSGNVYLLCTYPLLPIASVIAVDAGIRRIVGTRGWRLSRVRAPGPALPEGPLP